MAFSVKVTMKWRMSFTVAIASAAEVTGAELKEMIMRKCRMPAADMLLLTKRSVVLDGETLAEHCFCGARRMSVIARRATTNYVVVQMPCGRRFAFFVDLADELCTLSGSICDDMSVPQCKQRWTHVRTGARFTVLPDTFQWVRERADGTRDVLAETASVAGAGIAARDLLLFETDGHDVFHVIFGRGHGKGTPSPIYSTYMRLSDDLTLPQAKVRAFHSTHFPPEHQIWTMEDGDYFACYPPGGRSPPTPGGRDGGGGGGGGEDDLGLAEDPPVTLASLGVRCGEKVFVRIEVPSRLSVMCPGVGYRRFKINRSTALRSVKEAMGVDPERYIAQFCNGMFEHSSKYIQCMGGERTVLRLIEVVAGAYIIVQCADLLHMYECIPYTVDTSLADVHAAVFRVAGISADDIKRLYVYQSNVKLCAPDGADPESVMLQQDMRVVSGTIVHFEGKY